MNNQGDDNNTKWQPGAWIKCDITQEQGQIRPHRGNRVRVDLGPGINLYGSPEVLRHQGWELTSAQAGKP